MTSDVCITKAAKRITDAPVEHPNVFAPKHTLMGFGPDGEEGKMADDEGSSYRSVWRYLMQVPFKQDYVVADGLRTRYVQAGPSDAPALLMLHGTGGHWETFCANIGPLSKHFNCVAIDMMGCGFTDKPDKPYEIAGYVAHALAFMDAVGVDRASMIGVSLGSWVATRFALTHPHRVDKLIMISPPGLISQPPQGNTSIENRRASAADPSWDRIAAILGNLVYDKSTMPADMIAVRQRIYSEPGIDRIMPRMLTLFDPAVRARNTLSEAEWRSVKAPALVIAHVDSPDIYLETANRIIDLLPNAQLVKMHKTAHWSHYEAADEFNDLAIRFLQGAKVGAGRQP